jgi:hypothetical protein
MNHKYFFGLFLAVLLFAIFGCGGTANPVSNLDPADQTPADTQNPKDSDWWPASEFPIMAGQNIEVGSVKVWNDTDSIHVNYSIYPSAVGWFLTEIHIAVADDPDDIPQVNGNPAPGLFPYKVEFDGPPWTVRNYTYEIPLSDLDGMNLDYFVVAAHCALVRVEDGEVVQDETGWGGDEPFPGSNWAKFFWWTGETCEIYLPTTQVGVRMYNPGPSSYWNHVFYGIDDGYDVDNGATNGWCVQQNVYAYPGTLYQATLYAVTDPNLPPLYQGFKWNEINWVLNHKGSAGINDIQQAIWYFCGSPTSLSPTAYALVLDAQLNGYGYIPGPGEIMAVVVYIAPNVQGTFIEVEILCL